nr:unnamed protein product [Callosobruchus chinensis]
MIVFERNMSFKIEGFYVRR